jgi:hypothetical protein
MASSDVPPNSLFHIFDGVRSGALLEQRLMNVFERKATGATHDYSLAVFFPLER